MIDAVCAKFGLYGYWVSFGQKTEIKAFKPGEYPDPILVAHTWRELWLGRCPYVQPQDPAWFRANMAALGLLGIRSPAIWRGELWATEVLLSPAVLLKGHAGARSPQPAFGAICQKLHSLSVHIPHPDVGVGCSANAMRLIVEGLAVRY